MKSLYNYLAGKLKADSSWIWLSKRKPYEIMPVVVVITICYGVCVAENTDGI